jgi:hypothetical protein
MKIRFFPGQNLTNFLPKIKSLHKNPSAFAITNNICGRGRGEEGRGCDTCYLTT